MGYLPYQLVFSGLLNHQRRMGMTMWQSFQPRTKRMPRRSRGNSGNFDEKTGVQFLTNRKKSAEKVSQKLRIIHLCWVKEWYIAIYIYIYIWYIYHNYITHTFIYIYTHYIALVVYIYIYIVCSDLVSRSCNNLKQPFWRYQVLRGCGERHVGKSTLETAGGTWSPKADTEIYV